MSVQARSQIGLVLMGGSPSGDVALAKRAEAAGFDSVFTVEFFNRHGYVPLAAIAAATERVRIGTAIANAFTRSPLLHASAAMDLDELSGGRMVLGLGSATRRMNEEWYGVPFEAPAARMRELVRLLHAAFAAQKGGGLRFEGDFWKLRIPLYSRPGAARETIPVWIAAVNRGMIAAAGAVADGLVGHPIATRRWHREVTLPGLREAEAAAGRAAGACALKPYVLTSIQQKREDAVYDAKCQIGFYYTTDLYHSVLDLHGLRHVGDACRAALKRLDFKAMAEAVPDELVDEIAIACTPDEAPDRLAQWDDLTDEPLLYPPSVGVAPERLAANHDALFHLFRRA
ncbi:MAG: LLM class flavin-dependent oxidoreductase [Proteobacteria bacterium]|nr:LLM class flavin-dependent oxidoreductase [Pseudomonadota bacterium]